MARTSGDAYQLKITLKGIRPPIWRRIQIPASATFSDLHYAIQDAMGWEGSHLHCFEVPNPKTGYIDVMEDSEYGPVDRGTIDTGKKRLSQYFGRGTAKATYVYDFGDDWIHEIRLEKTIPIEKGVRYPLCTAGKRACPPEDVGGIWGYGHALEVLANPNSAEYKEMKEWFPEDFDPDHFSPAEVVFRDKREQISFNIADVPDKSYEEAYFKESDEGPFEEDAGHEEWAEEDPEEMGYMAGQGEGEESEEGSGDDTLALMIKFFLSDEMAEMVQRAERGDRNGLNQDQKMVLSVFRERLDDINEALDILNDPEREEDEEKYAVAVLLKVLSMVNMARQVKRNLPPEAGAFYKDLKNSKMRRGDILAVMSDIYTISLSEGDEEGFLDRYTERLSRLRNLSPNEIYDELDKEMSAIARAQGTH